MRLAILVLIFLFSLSNAGPIRDMLASRTNISQKNLEIPSDTKMLWNLPYGNDPKQTLDVYLPYMAKSAPIVVMVHGGAWAMGDKEATRVVKNKAGRWNPKGIIFVSVNYRLLPDADPLKQAKDVANALIYIQKHSASWGGDPRKIILMGHSAGAHLVTLISAGPAGYKGLKPWLGTISLDSAAMDISKVMRSKHYRFYDKAFGNDPNYWKQASPYHMLTKNEPPILLVCSTMRQDKPCIQAEEYSEKIKLFGIRSEILPVAMSHGQLNEELGLESDYTKRVEEFIRSLGIAI